MHLYAEYLEGIRPTLMRNNVKLIHLGRVEGLPVPVQYGGQGRDLLSTLIAMEALGRGCRDQGEGKE